MGTETRFKRVLKQSHKRGDPRIYNIALIFYDTSSSYDQDFDIYVLEWSQYKNHVLRLWSDRGDLYPAAW